MKEIQTDIEINAPIKKVWDVFFNFSSYPQWSKFLKKIAPLAEEGTDGTIEVGKDIIVEMQPQGKKVARFGPEILVLKPQKEFRWIGKFYDADFIFVGEHYFLFESVGGNKTKVTQGEKFKGLLVPFMGRIIKITRHGFLDFNESLKNRCEK